jgi:hypothetical protein
MTTNTLPNKIARVQVAFNATDAMNTRIQNLYQKYYGLSLSEIVKLAIIELDKSTAFEDETAYLTSSVKNKLRLDSAIAQPNKTSRRFSTTKNLADELGVSH